MIKLIESLWSEIQDRSCGKAVRKEDDINHLSGKDMRDYIKVNYRLLNTFAIITYINNVLCVPIIKIN